MRNEDDGGGVREVIWVWIALIVVAAVLALALSGCAVTAGDRLRESLRGAI